MIPGNIDLTENLDFRNVRKREIPQLPASWKEKDRINVDNECAITTISNTNITLTYRMDDGSDMRVSNVRIVNRDHNTYWTYTHEWNSNTIVSYNNGFYTYIDYINDYYDDYNTISTTSSNESMIYSVIALNNLKLFLKCHINGMQRKNLSILIVYVGRNIKENGRDLIQIIFLQYHGKRKMMIGM